MEVKLRAQRQIDLGCTEGVQGVAPQVSLDRGTLSIVLSSSVSGGAWQVGGAGPSSAAQPGVRTAIPAAASGPSPRQRKLGACAHFARVDDAPRRKAIRQMGLGPSSAFCIAHIVGEIAAS